MRSPAKRPIVAEPFQRLLQRLGKELEHTLEVPAGEPIHDLRVAIRRFDQVLKTFQTWFDERQVLRVRRRLKTTFSNAGAVRDCDIVIDLLGKTGREEVGRISGDLHVRRKAAQHRLVASVRALVRQNVASRWRKELAGMSAPPGAEGLSWDDLARQELPQRARKFFQAGNRAQKKSDPEDLHNFRIAAKKFRYTFELFESALGPTAESRLDNLRKLQSVLGDINDIRTARTLVHEFGGGKKLDAILRKKLRKSTAEFRSMWEAQFPPNEIAAWMEFFERPLRKPVARSESVQQAPRRGAAKHGSAAFSAVL